MSRAETFHMGTKSQEVLAKAVDHRIEYLQTRKWLLRDLFLDGDELATLYALRITFCQQCEGYGCERCVRPSGSPS